MKNFSSFAFLFMLLSTAFAQNWAPLPNGHKAHFRIDTSSLITHTLWVDSTDVVNGNSVSYLNRTVGPCDTCSLNSTHCTDPNYPAPCIYLPQKHMFLQQKMTLRADGSWLFERPGTLVLRPTAGLNQSWLFDSVNNVTATVTAVQAKMVFQVMDSVKTISLSNGQQIELSQNHGLLSFPNRGSVGKYVLDGLEGTNSAGTQVPSFWEIYDFEVGDVFQHWSHKHAGLFVDELVFEKTEILAKRRHGDTLEYDCYRFRREESHGSGSPPVLLSFDQGAITWRFIFDDGLPENSYPGELIMRNQHHIVIHVLRLEEDSLWGIGKTYGRGKDFWTKNIQERTLLEELVGEPGFYYPLGFGDDTQTFHPHLGRTHFRFIVFEENFEGGLMGHVRNGDTLGTIDPDAFFSTTIDPELNRLPFQVAPNPSDGIFQLNWEMVPTNATITVHNALGQRLFEQSLVGQQEFILDLSGHPKGLYWVRLQIGERSAVKRITMIE